MVTHVVPLGADAFDALADEGLEMLKFHEAAATAHDVTLRRRRRGLSRDEAVTTAAPGPPPAPGLPTGR